MSKVKSSLRRFMPESWGLLYAAFAFSQSIGLITYWTLPIVTGALIDGLGLSVTKTGLIGTTEFLGLLVASVLLSPFVDKGFRKRIAFVSVLIVVLVNLISAFTTDYSMFLVLRFVAGLGSGLALAIGNATIANARDVETFSGYLTMALVAFMVVIMPVYSRISAAYGFQGIYLATALVVVLGGISIFFLPSGPNADLVDEKKPEPKKTEGISVGRIAIVGVILVAILFGVRDTLPWLVAEQLGADAGLSLTELGNLFSLMYGVSILGPVVLIFLARFVGPRFLLLATMVLTGLFSWVFTVSDGHALQFSLGIIIWATVYFMAFAQLNAVAALYDRRGRLVSAVGSCFIAGIMLAPVLGGYLVDQGGYEYIGSAELAITLLIALIILGGLPRNGKAEPGSG